jgi:ABC-type dipeptide/oligopeptide/nickel transport system permease component
MIPGDPATAIAGDAVSPEILAKIRTQLGLDRPFYQQVFVFMKRMFQLDFGVSFITGEKISTALLERFPHTLILAFSAMLFATLSGVTIGVISALHRNTWIDRAAQYFVLIGISTPVFFLGLLLLFLFTIYFRLLPSIGDPSPWGLILPAITLGTQSAALFARITRSTMLDILPKDHVKFAKARGIGNYAVLFRHVLLNASIPIITLIVLDLGSYLNGSVITETVFGWPGIGSYIYYDGILKRDFPVIQAVLFLGAIIFLAANFFSDMINIMIDPRLRNSEE